MASDYDTNTRGRQPITGHPLFAGIVALWFGALFGLGSLVVRVSLIEAAVTTTQIDTLIPAAAAPLGPTGRIVIAIGLALFGATIGALVARWLGRSGQAAPDYYDEAGEAEVVQCDVPAIEGRRRALTLDDDRSDSANPLDRDPEIIDLVALGLHSRPEPIETAPIETPAIEAALPEAVPIETPTAAPAPFPLPQGTAAERLTSAALDSLSHVELIERLALSLQKRRDTPPAAAPDLSAGMPPPPLPQLPQTADDGFVHEFSNEPADDELDEEYEAAELDEHAYSSLIGIGGSPYPQPSALVPDEGEPVVVFPGQTTRNAALTIAPAPLTAQSAALQQDPEETERALRAALASLQRMSGAA